MWSNGICDASAREWIVTWHITNRSEEATAITDVEALPEKSTIVWVPDVVAGGATAYAYQRVPADDGGVIVFNAKWADGTTVANRWYFDPVATCA